MPYLVPVLVAAMILGAGHVLEALLALLMCSAYLRPSEALRLHAEDAVRPAAPQAPHVALNLHSEESIVLQPRYIPYQLRHNGPSCDRRHNIRIALNIKQRGLW